MLLRLAAASALLAVGCAEPDGPCAGDCGLPIEVVPFGKHDGSAGPLTDGAAISIERPLQGGWVIYVGVQARNVHGETAQLTAALRAVDSPGVVAIEQRPVRLVDDGTGLASPEAWTQDLANLPVCPDVGGPPGFLAAPWRVELHLDDRDGRTADAAVVIQPVCSSFDGDGCAMACQ